MAFHSLDEFEKWDREELAEAERAVNYYQLEQKPGIFESWSALWHRHGQLWLGSALLFAAMYLFAWLWLHLDGRP